MNQHPSLANPPQPKVSIRGDDTAPPRLFFDALTGRLILFAVLVASDVAILAYIPHSVALLGPLAPIAIVAFVAFIGLGNAYLKEQREPLPFSPSLLAVHLACVSAVSCSNFAAIRSPQSGVDLAVGNSALRVVLVAGIAFLALACVPLNAWIRTIRDTGWLGPQALLAGGLAWCLRFPMQSFWNPNSTAAGGLLQGLTFRCVAPLLRALLPGIIVDPGQFAIGTDRFAVTIAEQCSGLEGLGLVLIFTVLWLWYFRQEMRFPHALLLIPCALICVWLLNIVRIAALVLIGNAGAPGIAMEGFHSQAGWISFTLVALAFSVASRRIYWLRKQPGDGPSRAMPESPSLSVIATPITGSEVIAEKGESPSIAIYLVPFLTILAVAFLSRAASGSFEWLYPLRFVAAALALWYYRAELHRLDWRFSWHAPVIGAFIFGLGIAASHILQPGSHSTLAEALAVLSPAARWTWVAFYIAAGVLTIPLAEELAFRGYLARRLIRISDSDFEQHPFSALTPLSMLLSSVTYGFMYGHLWLFGLLAGLIYTGLAKWKSRLGDAVVAHSVANLLLACWLAYTGNWSLW